MNTESLSNLLRNAADEVGKMDAWRTSQEPPPGMDYEEWIESQKETENVTNTSS